MKLTKSLGTTLLIGAVLVALCGCDMNEGPAEKAGKQVDEAAEEAGEKIEEVGEKLQEATQ